MNHKVDISYDSIEQRRADAEAAEANRVTFRVEALYGFSPNATIPIGNGKTIDSGPITLCQDPEAAPEMNIGVIDFEQRKLVVRYGAQFVFPGLFELVNQGGYDPALLNPVRVTATDHCSVAGDYSGWHAVGCLDFLQGSLWAGAKGG